MYYGFQTKLKGLHWVKHQYFCLSYLPRYTFGGLKAQIFARIGDIYFCKTSKEIPGRNSQASIRQAGKNTYL